MPKSNFRKPREHLHASTIPLSFEEKMLAGAIARGVAQTVLHPVDVVRTRLQARDVAASWKPGVFLKGVIPQITLAIPAGAIQFLAFEAAKEKLIKWIPDEKLSQTRTLLAGAFGAFAAASCRVPQEVLKQRIQADIYPNMAVALQQTLFKTGPASLYTGWLATLSRDIPWNALSFMFHAQGKKIFSNTYDRAPANDENLIIAGIAGAISAIIMTPIDVVKTRIMTQRVGAAQYSGLVGTLKKIVAEEGAGTLMKGVLPRVVFLAPLAGITFSVYEAVAANLRKRKELASKTALAEPGVEGAVSSQHSELRGRKVAVRFSKSAVQLSSRASSKAQTMADFSTASPIFFSLPA